MVMQESIKIMEGSFRNHLLNISEAIACCRVIDTKPIEIFRNLPILMSKFSAKFSMP